MDDACGTETIDGGSLSRIVLSWENLRLGNLRSWNPQTTAAFLSPKPSSLFEATEVFEALALLLLRSSFLRERLGSCFGLGR